MKQRFLFLRYLLVIAFTAIISLVAIWHFTPLKSKVRAQIVQELEYLTGNEVFLHDFTLTPFSVFFHHIEIAPPGRRIVLQLEGIRIEYSWFKLLQHRLNPIFAVERIVLMEPRVILQTRSDAPADSTPGWNAHSLQRVLYELQKLPQIDRIEIENGAFFWKPGSGKPQVVLSAVQGFLRNQAENRLQIQATGSLREWKTSSIALQAILDFDTHRLDMTLAFDSCQVGNGLPALSHRFYKLERAVIDGRLRLQMPEFHPDSLQIAGTLLATGVSGKIFNQQVQAEAIQLQFSRRDVTILPFEGRVEDGLAYFQGKIFDLYHPRIDWSLEIQDYSAKYLQKSHEVFEYVLDGKVRGHARFTGPLLNMKIEADLKAPTLQYAVVPFINTRARLVYQDRILRLEYYRADFMKFVTTGTGVVDFNTDRLRLNMRSEIRVPEETFSFLDRLNRARVGVLTRMSGDFIRRVFTGQFQYYIEDDQEVLIRGQGPLRLVDQFLTFSLVSDGLADTIHVVGRVANVFSDPTFKILDIRNFPVERLTTLPVFKNIARDYRVNAYFAGPYDFLATKVIVVSRYARDHVFTFQGNLKNVFMDYQKFFGRFQAQTAPLRLRGDIVVNITPEGILARLQSPNLVGGQIHIGSGPNGRFEGRIAIQKFRVQDYISHSSALSRILQQGTFQGEILFSGTVSQPHVQFRAEADEFIINNVGYYSTRIEGELRNHRWVSDEFVINLNNLPVCIARGSWDLYSDSLDIEIRGENIESNFLAETLLRDKELIQGTFSYGFRISGTFARPSIEGDVLIRNGYFENNPFDLINISFRDSLPPGVSLWTPAEHILQIRKFLYVNRQEYTIEAEGILGIAEEAPLDIRIDVTGNVLSELPRIQPFFRSPRSNGHLYLHITGSRAQPQLAEAALKITSGSLSFESVLPPLHNLKADIVLDGETQQVHIRQLEGTFNGRKALVYNVFESPIASRDLQPWYFEEFNLNFGILVLKTDPRGIPLSIPGMMMPGDIGYFAVDGKVPGEDFYFAGPVTAPVVRGKVILYNARVTFPFLEEDVEEEPGKVVEFMRNIEWDLLAVSGRGNRYFVDIPAYVGQVYLDLNIDNNSPGLEFTGRLIDDSFRVEGMVESSRGQVEYLDINFRVEKFGAEFNRFELYPHVYGRAYTTVRDSTGFPRDIYLVLYAIDPETGQEVAKGSWETFRFKLVSSDPVVGETQEQVLAYLGYSVQNIQRKASKVGFTITENFLIRPLVRPLERRLERGLHLDYVRFSSKFTTNLFYLSLGSQAKLFQQPSIANPGLNQRLDPMLLLLQSSEVTLGKYLARNLYLTYSGQLVSLYDEAKIGFNHRFGLEYRLLRNLLLEIEYDRYQFNPVYYSREALRDFRIRLRHSFNF
ncbi:MAG: hypothetical protein GXO78_03840 [Calditrichaeota bacterium]|nr:hypothetical protein [Calditrichota bacterium]